MYEYKDSREMPLYGVWEKQSRAWRIIVWTTVLIVTLLLGGKEIMTSRSVKVATTDNPCSQFHPYNSHRRAACDTSQKGTPMYPPKNEVEKGERDLPVAHPTEGVAGAF